MDFKRLSKVLAEGAPNHLWFWCKPCGRAHGIVIGPTWWSWNTNADAPTFQPSVKCEFNIGERQVLCHTFVTDGKIQYLSDCTHELAGQTVSMWDWEQ